METDNTRRRVILAGLALLPLPGLVRAQQCRVTPRDALGPFYKPNAPARDELCARGSGGARKLLVTGRVFGMPDCRPLPGALVEVWQADEAGHYTQVGSKRDDEACLLRARLTTDSEGRYRFSTILPGEYPGRPRHIHYRVSHSQHPPLVTQLYFERHRGVPDALVVAVATGAQGTAEASFDITLAPT